MQGFIGAFLILFIIICNPIVLIAIVIGVIIYNNNNIAYKDSAYHNITHNSYLSTRFNKGRYGEYLTYKYLKKYEELGARFLFNVYIPKENGETTEIDVMMISSKGIFVFESKNYSGWIFGNENQKNWYQTLPVGRGKSRKENFYNPVMQNRTHIKYLKMFVGEQIPMRSIITFSERCTLKNVQITSNDVSVINRHKVNEVVAAIYNQTTNQVLNLEQINEIFHKIYPYTQVSEATKARHIVNINNSEKIGNDMITTRNVVVNLGRNINDVKIHIKPEVRNLHCPKCSSKLVLRTAKRGANIGNKFYGCSNYPKCRYIQNLEK